MCLFAKKRSEPLKQNDPALLPDIQAVGCFFRCALRMAEDRLGRNLTAEEINAEWTTAKADGILDQDNNLKNAAKLATNCLRRLGGSGSFVEVATQVDGETGWYAWVTVRRADYRIKKIYQAGPSRTHFVEVDRTGRVTWDPHEPAIAATSDAYTVFYRYDGE